MKLEKQNADYCGPITVSFIPSKFERCLGFKNKTTQFVNSGQNYYIGGGIKWLNYPDMTVYGGSALLDAFLRRSKNKQGYTETNNCVREYGWASIGVLSCLLLFVLSWVCFFRIHIDNNPALTVVYIIIGSLLGIAVLLLLRRVFVLLVKGLL